MLSEMLFRGAGGMMIFPPPNKQSTTHDHQKQPNITLPTLLIAYVSMGIYNYVKNYVLNGFLYM